MNRSHNVIAILEAKPEKAVELESALINVAQQSRQEEACLEYCLNKSNDNPNQFVLFERWQSQEKHQEQFTKPYITELGARLEELLAKPYQVIMAAEL